MRDRFLDYLINEVQLPNNIVCDENVFSHAIFLINPWNEPDWSSFYSIQILINNKITLLVNDFIIKHYSKTFNKISSKIRENEEFTSFKTAIFNQIKNYYTQCKQYHHFDKNSFSIIKPKEIRVDDEDFFYLTIIYNSEIIVNDSELRKGVLKSNGIAYYSCEFLRKYLPIMIKSENLHKLYPKWWILDFM